jgi:hypothetical protein
MGTSKKTTSFHETYGSAQTDTDIITPNGGDALFIWSVVVDSPGVYSLHFPTSGLVIEGKGGLMGAVPINKLGAASESLQLTCPAGTTVRILYDEV